MAEYFVKVDDGKELRKQLLESSKLSIHIIKQEFKIKDMRSRKNQLMEKVRDDLKELTYLIGALEKDLPVLTKKELAEIAPKKPEQPILKKAEEKSESPKKPVSAESTAENKEYSKLRRLESSLEMIEKRLGNL